MWSAHRQVCNVLLQVFDEGHLTDGQGRKVDFRNTILLMTSQQRSALTAQLGSRPPASTAFMVSLTFLTSYTVCPILCRVRFSFSLSTSLLSPLFPPSHASLRCTLVAADAV